jgi:hypothetical protein
MTDETPKLTGEAVRKTILAALYDDGDNTENGVLAKGILRDFMFHPDRLEAQRATVKAFLREIDPPFHQLQGGGWSFLNFCQSRDGQWTGTQLHMEELMCLGVGLGFVEELPLPRDVLPGGVPYIVIKHAVWD